jgi:uncharacterized membrane protein
MSEARPGLSATHMGAAGAAHPGYREPEDAAQRGRLSLGEEPSHPVKDGRLAACLIGFSMGGFFDGILLHQILQWHHLLSGVTSGIMRELRTQILFDGLFHALMYAIGFAGVCLLLRYRVTVPRMRLWALMVISFGVWHVLDTLVSHWLLGIHRIRTDVPDPLMWDIAWLVWFGILPIWGGIVLMRRQGRLRPAAQPPQWLISLMVVAAASASLWPAGAQADGSRYFTVVLQDRPEALLQSLGENEARVVWNDEKGHVWVLQAPPGLSRWSLYRHGAVLVSGTLLPAGCNAWRG